MPSAAHGARAHVRTESGFLYGFGAAATAEYARNVAVMECAERWTQFAQPAPAVVRDTFAALGDAAICPLDFGLYAASQYRRPGFPFAPFDERVPLEWVAATDVHTGEERLVSLEFMHPNAVRGRPRLMAETSSGTAIDLDARTATEAALCEAVERDAVLLFWHRRPRTRVEPLSALPAGPRAELAAARRSGRVVVVCRLASDIALPAYLVLALRGTAVACGAAANRDPAVALARAARELGADLRQSASGASQVHLPLRLVRSPADHRALYDRGPLNDVFRAALDGSLVPGGPKPLPAPYRGAAPALAAAGFRAYSRDLTPPRLADCGVRVVRALIPGLIPLSFGHGRIRLGCRRLTGPDAPGRLVTLLPHFLS